MEVGLGAMFPISDVIPSRTKPLLTVAIILLTTLVFVYQVGLGARLDEAFIARHGLVPSQFGLATLFTSMVLHAGWAQFLVNMLYLWIFGDNVEDRLGRGRFLVLYLLCGASAAIAQTGTSPGSPIPIVGANGAVAGVLGGYFRLYPHSRVLMLLPFPLTLVEVPAMFFLCLWVVMQLLSGLATGALTAGRLSNEVALWAHLPAFVTRVLACSLMRRPERQRVEWWGR